MAEDKRRSRHTLNMDERERLKVGGVLEVLSFDEEGVMMETDCGLLVLKGAGLHIGKLDLESGDISVEGSIDSIAYSDSMAQQKGSLLHKLFR